MGVLIMLALRCWSAFGEARWRARRASVAAVLVLQGLQTSFDVTRLVLVSSQRFRSDLRGGGTPRKREEAGGELAEERQGPEIG